MEVCEGAEQIVQHVTAVYATLRYHDDEVARPPVSEWLSRFWDRSVPLSSPVVLGDVFAVCATTRPTVRWQFNHGPEHSERDGQRSRSWGELRIYAADRRTVYERIRTSAEMPSPACSFRIISIVSGRRRFKTSATRARLPR